MASQLEVGPYEYGPLLEEGAIRLMTLYPGQFDDDIVVDIESTSLMNDQKPVYEALSYVCGDPKKEFAVFVRPRQDGSLAKPQMRELAIGDTGAWNEDPAAEPSPKKQPSSVTGLCGTNVCRKLPITENLNEALRYLRRTDKECVVWVDAICIHQDNVVERGRQVQCMAQIYSLASRVKVWLGPEENESAYAIGTLCKLGTKADDRGYLQETDFKVDGFSVDNRNSIDLDSRSFLAIHHFLKREWFQRLWTRQEIHLGSEGSVVRCGHFDWPWPALRKGIRTLYLQPFSYPPDLRFDEIIETFVASRQRAFQVVDTVQRSLPSLLAMTREAKCSDSRDRVFAILGMVGSQDQEIADAVTPDYTKTVEEVFADVFECTMKVRRRLDLLQFCDKPRDSDYRPTWGPDWSRPSSTYTSACHLADALSDLGAERIDRLRLRVKGYVAAVMRTVNPTMAPRLYEGQKMMNLLKNHLEMAKLETQLTLGEFCNAYCHVLMDGLFGENVSPTNHHYCSLDEAKSILEFLLTSESLALTSLQNLKNFNHFESCLREALTGRAWITTEEGYIGLAPSSVQPGDSICVLLGSPYLIALTPDRNSGRQVLGPCYVHGLTSGEALLGKLPEDTKMVRVGQPEGWDWKFQDVKTGCLYTLDPRVDWDELEEDIASDRWWHQIEDSGKRKFYRLPDAEYYKKRGVNIEDFILI